ncbi:MAG TPA: DUF4160 domain-containing protein [Pirellulales bacterium]|nr:DUF4160 domain-containing protein [Pirellulales bacterium]
MPVISRFYGITVHMYYDDHAPPHFHADYAEDELIVGISPITILKGKSSARVRSMTIEWAGLRQVDLLENWERARRGESMEPIPPLD